jgi:hypothetical protein
MSEEAIWVKCGPAAWRYFKDQAAYDAARGVKIDVHSVIDDSMPPTWHPCTGETIDSKRRFREITRANGCVELDGMNLNPGQRPIQEDKTEVIGKQIYDIMESMHVDEKVIKREIAEYFRNKG